MTMTGPGKKNSRIVILHAADYQKLIKSIGKIDGAEHVMTAVRGMSRRDFLAASRIPPWVARRRKTAA